MHYVGVQAGETTVRLVGRCNPLRLSLSAFLYLYSKCQCINGFRGGHCHGEEESEGCEEQRRNRAGTTGCLCALGEPCKQHGEGKGIYRRNRCLLSAPVGLLCNNRPVTLRKCREAACAFASVFVRLFFLIHGCMCVLVTEQGASASSTA